ncbi:putative leucine-rich repeat domain superfamily [Dioscorea sansibarensis]
MEDRGSQWLSYIPESSTSLVTLNIACLEGEVNAGALGRLVSRSPNLRILGLNHAVSVETLAKILACAPQLVDLETGSFMLTDRHSDAYHKLYGIFHKSKYLRSMSGLWNAAPHCLPALYPIC